MLSPTRTTLAIAFAATILGASPALAMPIGDHMRGERADALSEPAVPRSVTGSDLRGEHAIAVTDAAAIQPADDMRSPDAREPVGGQGAAQPVVVEVSDPAGGAFDWTAAIIGVAAGLALAVIVGVGVAGGRRRPRTV